MKLKTNTAKSMNGNHDFSNSNLLSPKTELLGNECGHSRHLTFVTGGSAEVLHPDTSLGLGWPACFIFSDPVSKHLKDLSSSRLYHLSNIHSAARPATISHLIVGCGCC